MRRPLMLATLAAIALQAHAESPSDAVDAFHRSLARGDAAAAAALLSPAVTIYESGYVERARDEYSGHHLLSERVAKSSERVSGDLAVVMRETETKGNYKGRSVHTFGTESAVLEKQGERWVIVHLHWSSRKGN